MNTLTITYWAELWLAAAIAEAQAKAEAHERTHHCTCEVCGARYAQPDPEHVQHTDVQGSVCTGSLGD